MWFGSAALMLQAKVVLAASLLLLGAGDAGATVAAFGTLNPADKAVAITLSNGNLTATHGAFVSWGTAKSTTSHSSGKYYWEWTVTNLAIASFTGAGFSNAAATVENYEGSSANGISIVTDGSVYQSGSGTATIASSTTGDIIGLAIDIPHQTLWVRKNGGLWNGSGGADPATNVGGVSLPSGLASGSIFAGIEVQSSLDAGTANFGATAFTQTVPSGFSAWG